MRPADILRAQARYGNSRQGYFPGPIPDVETIIQDSYRTDIPNTLNKAKYTYINGKITKKPNAGYKVTANERVLQDAIDAFTPQNMQPENANSNTPMGPGGPNVLNDYSKLRALDNQILVNEYLQKSSRAKQAELDDKRIKEQTKALNKMLVEQVGSLKKVNQRIAKATQQQMRQLTNRSIRENGKNTTAITANADKNTTTITSNADTNANAIMANADANRTAITGNADANTTAITTNADANRAAIIAENKVRQDELIKEIRETYRKIQEANGRTVWGTPMKSPEERAVAQRVRELRDLRSQVDKPQSDQPVIEGEPLTEQEAVDQMAIQYAEQLEKEPTVVQASRINFTEAVFRDKLYLVPVSEPSKADVIKFKDRLNNAPNRSGRFVRYFHNENKFYSGFEQDPKKKTFIPNTVEKYYMFDVNPDSSSSTHLPVSNLIEKGIFFSKDPNKTNDFLRQEYNRYLRSRESEE